MKLKHFARAFAPVIGIALAAAVAGCDGASFKINGEDGKKLADLDMSGKVPDEIVLAGPDEVQIAQGDKLAITVDGDPEAAAKVRFTLKDGTLGIMREGKVFEKDGNKVAVVHVTMPAPREMVMAGSGKIVAAALAPKAKVTVAGSGEVETPNVSSDSLELTIAGSGSYRAAGSVKSLEMSVAGSGSANSPTLKTDKAEVTIAGSGDATFASDGEVEVTIMGSGSVMVKGRARCKVSSMGSGKLICEGPVEQADSAPKPPAPPAAPEAPPSPE
ncbi:MAG: DUF2807 domain-containing protein [Sphingomonadales bacterium]|nr:DUF2807 domain-containing protein [Sphingomonadales bacterium]